MDGENPSVGVISILGEDFAVERDGHLIHWMEPCMDCGRERQCYRVASVAEPDVSWGVCAHCLAARIDQNARDQAKNAIDRAWELPTSVWAECEICRTLEPVDQLMRVGDSWICVAKHDEETE